MRIVRFLDLADTERYGCDMQNGAALVLSGSIGSFQVTDERVKVRKLLAPIRPSSIMGIGLNYRKHAEEGAGSGPFDIPDYPVLFFKGTNSVQNPHDPIEIPAYLQSTQVDYECELAVVIGKECKNASRETAFEYVLGYTCANDVSARDWQIGKGGSQWCRGKSFDTFSPLGPCIVTPEDIPDPNNLRIQTKLNGQIMQDWRTDDMIFDIPAIISFLSGSSTLMPGTVILTGTPHGVGMAQKPPRWLRVGDEVTISIERIGDLTNSVVEESLT